MLQWRIWNQFVKVPDDEVPEETEEAYNKMNARLEELKAQRLEREKLEQDNPIPTQTTSEHQRLLDQVQEEDPPDSQDLGLHDKLLSVEKEFKAFKIKAERNE